MKKWNFRKTVTCPSYPAGKLQSQIQSLAPGFLHHPRLSLLGRLFGHLLTQLHTWHLPSQARNGGFSVSTFPFVAVFTVITRSTFEMPIYLLDVASFCLKAGDWTSSPSHWVLISQMSSSSAPKISVLVAQSVRRHNNGSQLRLPFLHSQEQ